MIQSSFQEVFSISSKSLSQVILVTMRLQQLDFFRFGAVHLSTRSGFVQEAGPCSHQASRDRTHSLLLPHIYSRCSPMKLKIKP